ncbi:MAG: ribose-phosphate diphosphokinase [Methanobacteriota archaeon]
MIIISGSASPKLSAQVASLLGAELVNAEIRHFPDGELYGRIDADLRRKPVAIIQSTCHPQNDNLIELLLLLDTAKILGAKRIVAIIPYLAYTRQDKRFNPGEAISLRTISKLISQSGAEEIITVDIHQEETLGNFSIPAFNLTAMPLLGRYLKDLDLKNPIFIGADQGSIKRSALVALELKAEHYHLEKRRITPENVIVYPKNLSVKGRDIVMVDDIVSTGGTIIGAAKMLQEQGARDVYVACAHPVLSGNARQKLKDAGIKQVIATDTIEKDESVVSVAPLIADMLK